VFLPICSKKTIVTLKLYIFCLIIECSLDKSLFFDLVTMLICKKIAHHASYLMGNQHLELLIL
jgi:hypothetical protein